MDNVVHVVVEGVPLSFELDDPKNSNDEVLKDNVPEILEALRGVVYEVP